MFVFLGLVMSGSLPVLPSGGLPDGPVGASTGSSCVMQRLQVVLGHLSGQPPPDWKRGLQAAPCGSRAPQTSAEDVVVVHGRRTAIGRGRRGGFKVRPWVRAS